jgi:iron complex transport system ATP-binding protein
MLRAEGVCLRLPDRSLVETLNLEFHPGERWAVLGMNGAGKSTLLQVLAGLRAPEAGVVMIDGTPMRDRRRRSVARRLGVLLQEETREYWGSVYDYVMLGRHPHARSVFGPTAYDRNIALAALGALDLEPLAARAYRSLSGGERQRARVAALIAQQPDILLLDEPLQHLDLAHQVALLEQLSERAVRSGALVIQVLHDLVLASRYCDRMLLLYGDGRYLHGPVSEMFTPERLGGLYGSPLEAHDLDGERVLLPARAPGYRRV